MIELPGELGFFVRGQPQPRQQLPPVAPIRGSISWEFFNIWASPMPLGFALLLTAASDENNLQLLGVRAKNECYAEPPVGIGNAPRRGISAIRSRRSAAGV